MTNYKLICSILFVLVAIGVGFVIYNNRWQDVPNENACANIDQINVTKGAQIVEDSKLQYATSSQQIFGKSTDGGVRIDYWKDGKLLLSEVGLYGETVNYKASYFVHSKNVYYFHEEVAKYGKSIYADDFDPNSKSVQIKDYYLDGGQNLCFWFIDQEPQVVNEEAKNYVKNTLLLLR